MLAGTVRPRMKLGANCLFIVRSIPIAGIVSRDFVPGSDPDARFPSKIRVHMIQRRS
jgi:hypothetical protein